MTTERVKVQTKETQEKAGFGQTAKDLLSNRALLGIILAALLLLVAQIMTQSINQYLFIDYFKNKEALSVMTLAGVLPSLALAPFAVPVSKRFGKKGNRNFRLSVQCNFLFPAIFSSHKISSPLYWH